MNRKTACGLTLIAMLSLSTQVVFAVPQEAGTAQGTTVGGADNEGDRVTPPKAPGGKGRKRAPHDPLGTDLKSSDSDSTAARKIALEESKLEKRKAKIARLRELATAQGNEQRLRALDDLERKMIAGHDRKVAKWRERLGRDRYDKVREKVKRKGHGKAKGDKDAKRGENGKRDGEHGRDADAGDDAQRGRGGGKGEEHGKDKALGKDKDRERGAGRAKDPGGAADDKGRKEPKGKGPGKGKKAKGDRP